MFTELQNINSRPMPFEFYTADDLWTDDYTSQQMLAHHLDDSTNLSSRNSAFIDRSVQWITTYFKLASGKKAADFGCGPGLYTSRLARTGADVTGIDFSKRSIQYAHETAVRENLNVRYIHQNYLDFETNERFDLIMMIYCDFCALSPRQRKIMLEKFTWLLNDGGSLLLDVYSLRAFKDRQETTLCAPNLLNGFWSASEYYGFLNTFKYEDEKVMLDKYTIIEANRTRTVYNWLQYFSPESIQTEFEQSGLKIAALFNDVAGTPINDESPEFAIVAKKSRM